MWSQTYSSGWRCLSARIQKEGIRRTTDKHIFIGVHCDGMYYTLHPIEGDIFLLHKPIFTSTVEQPTGKQPLAMGDRSEILTGFSVALGGIGLP